MAAEAALARHELASDGRRLKLAMVFGVILGLSLFAAVIQGSLLLVLVLAPSVGGITNAAALSTIGMLLVAALMAFAIWRLLARPSGIASLVKRWRMAMDFGKGGSR